jgi:hypothetical protein
MAVAMIKGVEAPVTLATTVKQFTGVTGAQTIVLWGSDVDVYVVATALVGLIADGGALPAVDRRLVPADLMPAEVDVSGKIFVGVAGASAGTLRCELK